MYTTGNPVCDQLICADFSGNLIPQRWYRVFVKSELNRPKPHLLAVNILADIVYWYRPAVIRNERGQITGYRKKFRGDLLQRSYAQLAETFGCSARQAKEAILFLEQTGVIKRVLRTVQANGREYANVLFLSLNAARLMELTAPEQSSGVFSDTNAAEFRQTGDGIPADTPSGTCAGPTGRIRFPAGGNGFPTGGTFQRRHRQWLRRHGRRQRIQRPSPGEDPGRKEKRRPGHFLHEDFHIFRRKRRRRKRPDVIPGRISYICCSLI